jgi:hypothetical protein
VERAVEADPLSAVSQVGLTIQLYHEGRFEEALGPARAAHRLQSLMGLYWLCLMLAITGRTGELRNLSSPTMTRVSNISARSRDSSSFWSA